MPDSELHVRHSYTISNAAVGALIHIGRLSLVPCDIRDWGDDGEDVDMPRLSELLGVAFRKAPVREKRGDVEVGGRIPAVRFPKWMYCPACRRMYNCDARDHGRLEDPVLCPYDNCKPMPSPLAPMPWVVVCENGHMGDVPWHHLAHRDARNQEQRTCRAFDALYFVSIGDKSGRLQIECRSCHGAFLITALKAPNLLVQVKCEGRQPWLYAGEKCDKRLQVAALGDHFVHFPVAVSALDIPPESRLDPRNDLAKRVRAHPAWRRLLELRDRQGTENSVVQQRVRSIASDVGCGRDAVWNLMTPAHAHTERQPVDDNPIAETHLLRNDEYRAFLNRITDYREYERFITVSRTDDWHEWLKRDDIPFAIRAIGRWVVELIAVTRLREVRALRGFTRVSLHGSGEARLVPPDLQGKSPWLPVAEFFGEGVFFTLDRSFLSRWNGLPAVQARSSVARHGFDTSIWSTRIGIDETNLPGFIAVHTLAHLLIREMAFECGYPAASLRERLYYSEGESAMTGVLVYLAAAEPGGSLGGIARLAEPERFAGLLARCAEKAEWCTLDPVCAEHEGRGEPRLNRAACHACCLLGETSCECSNLMLDRRLVVSGPGANRTGLFDLDCGVADNAASEDAWG
ncbi:MAG: hypothetical protein FJ276_26900 [Planctomycetes bacterium]|nr:hypothetical protein [Planctomycetota bacterium]